MEHNEIRHALSDYLDGALAPAEQETVEQHLKTCSQCSDALRELRKTVEHVRHLEQVEPPAWMTQKIMARVREDERKRTGLLQRLFFPLHIKLPVEAFGVVLLALTAVFIYHTTQPVDRSEQMAPVFQKAESPELSKELRSKDNSAPETKTVPQQPEYRALDMKPAYEPPPPPVPEKRAPAPGPAELPEAARNEGFAEQRPTQPHSAAPGIMREQGRGEDLGRLKDEKKKGPGAEKDAAPASDEKAADSRAGRMTGSVEELKTAQQPGGHITVAVVSLAEASARIENTIKELGGAVIRKEAAHGSLDLSVKVSQDRRPQLTDLLKKLGNVKESGRMNGDVMRIRLVEGVQ